MRGMNKQLRTMLVALANLGWCSIAVAQESGKAPEIEDSPAWFPVMVALVALAGIAVVGFKNARRTHLD
jgi:hypothetical protein